MMNQVLRRWTKIRSFQFQLPIVSISQLKFELHVRRCHDDQHKCDVQTQEDLIRRKWYREHRPASKLFRDLTRRNKEDKNYISESMIEMLGETFDMSPKCCTKIAKLKQFESCSDSSLAQRVKFLKEMNVREDHLKGAPWLLWIKEGELKMKFDLLKNPFLFKSSFDGLGFTIFGPSLISYYETKFREEGDEFFPYVNKIYYIGQKLNLPIDILSIKLAHAWQVLHTSREKIDMLIAILLEFKFSPNEIVNDIWVFLHNPEQTRRRLSMMREASGGMHIKLWMCRCTEFDFNRAYARRLLLKSDRTVVEILQQDLGLSLEESMSHIRRANLAAYMPRSIEDKIQVFKRADESLDLLRKYPYLLRYSHKSLSMRVTSLKGAGLGVTCYLLQLSSKKFEDYLNRHKKH